MAPELRKRKSKPAVEEPESVAKKAKTTKAAPKPEKRKAPEDASPIATKKQRPSKDAVASKKAAAPAEKPTPKKSALKKEKQSPKAKAAPKKSTKVTKEEQEQQQQDEEDVPSEEEEEEEVDDDTQALVEKLDDGDDEDEPEKQQISTYKKGQDVGKVPKAKKPSKPTAGASSDKAGVMYLARLPHGFYEHELRSYFGQFGDITRLRVVRSKKTGASRHRAFVEFADAEVADIAARTMDKYLLFGHILTAKVVPPTQVHPNLFKGANRRFKVVPWNKMAGRQLERPLSEGQWQVRISKEEKRRAKRAEKLKDMGYEFEPPQLKAAEAKPLLEDGAEEEAPKVIEPAPAAIEESESKGEEEKQVAALEAKAEGANTAEEATPQKRKGRKGKKTKS